MVRKNCAKSDMVKFKWNEKKRAAALLLAKGYTEQETADTIQMSRRSVTSWKADDDFMLEVDKLTLLTGIALRAERLRIAARAIRQKAPEDEGKVKTSRDLLDWIKYVQGETDGVRFDIGTLFDGQETVTEVAT